MSKIKELLENELSDYSFWQYSEPEVIEEYDGWKYYQIEIFDHTTKTKTLYFRENYEKLQIDLSEDSWYDIEYFDWTVKYFWMALLNW